MSRLYKSEARATGLEGIILALRASMNDAGSDFVPTGLGKSVLGMESLGTVEFGTAHRHIDTLTKQLKNQFEGALQIGNESFSDATLTRSQLLAGAIVASALENPRAYAEKSYKNLRVSSEGGRVIDTDGSDFDLSPALESFDESDLKQNIVFSVAFNVLSARQDAFGEAFFPTVVLTPDQAGLELTVRRAMVLDEVRHKLSGAPTDFNRKNLIDAVVDYRVLENESTLIIPRVVAAGPDANLNRFIDPSLVAPYNRTTDAGTVITTAPLAVGVDIDLLGLSNRDDITAQGTPDFTDSLNQLIHLDKIYLRLTGTDSAALAATSIARIDVSRQPRNQWLKSQEGLSRAVTLNYETETLTLSAKQFGAAVATSALGFLDALATGDLVIHLALHLTGSGNLEFGSIRANASSATIKKIYEVAANGDTTDVTSTQLAAVSAALSAVEFVGYDAYATRSNLNRRTRGQLLDTVEYTEKWRVGLGFPMTIPSPVYSNRDAGDLATLINAVRIKNSNNAVSTLLAHAATLEALELSYTDRTIATPNIEGIGRLVVRPFYATKQIDVLAGLNSVSSTDRTNDIRATLVNPIRELVYRMVRDSGYQPALDAATGNSGEEPIVLIGTDPTTARYLMQDGDTRTLGFGLDHQVVTSMDQRVYGKIFVTLTRKGQVGADALSFGQFAWIPELAATVQNTRNGALSKEAMVQPRSRHIVNLPLMLEFDVVNLDKAMNEASIFRTDEV